MSNRMTRSFITRPLEPSVKARRHTLAQGRSRVSAAQLPLVAQDLAEPPVMPFAAAVALLAPDPHRRAAVASKGLAARDVLGVDLGHELVEVELAERVSRA